MNTTVHDITDARTKTNRRAKIALGVTSGVFLAGVILLIDDKLKKVYNRKPAQSETDES